MKFQKQQTVVIISDLCPSGRPRVEGARLYGRVIEVDGQRRRYLITPECGDVSCGDGGCLYSPGDEWYSEADIYDLNEFERALGVAGRVNLIAELTSPADQR